MSSFDEEIAKRIQEALDSGELSLAKGYGKPLPDDPDWDATPAALRMQMKFLRDAGVAPPEVALFHERARLRELMSATTEPAERQKLQHQLSQLELRIALRLESLQNDTKL